MADSDQLTVDTAQLAAAATEIGNQKPTIVRTQSTVSTTSLPSEAFGRLSASRNAAEHHSSNMTKVKTALDQAGQDLDRLVARLRSRQRQYEQAVRRAVQGLEDLVRGPRPPMSAPGPPMTPWPHTDGDPPMSRRP
jgi:hypothetical protein